MAVFDNDIPLYTSTIRHTSDDLKPFATIADQHAFRRRLVLDWLKDHGLTLDFDAVIGRGGIVKPVEGGVYRVNRAMCRETYTTRHAHASNLGCIIAYELARMQEKECPAFMADPVTVDEMMPEAHVSGSPLMPRTAIWHALNQRAIARLYARECGREYEDLRLIVCHLGGGISVAAHIGGRAVDVNNALDGEGPFSPERAGSLPSSELIHLCFSGRYTEEQLKRRISGEAGVMAHLGTTDIPALVRRIGEGDNHARLIIDAMIFHTAKAIAAEGAVLCGKVDAVLLTGGIAHCAYVVEGIVRRINYLAPVRIYPGEDEMKALALNALSVLRGECRAKEY